MRNLNKLSLLILVFACPVFVWAQTKRSPEFKERSHLNLLRKYKMGDFCIFVLPQTISYKSPICTKYSAKIQ